MPMPTTRPPPPLAVDGGGANLEDGFNRILSDEIILKALSSRQISSKTNKKRGSRSSTDHRTSFELREVIIQGIRFSP